MRDVGRVGQHKRGIRTEDLKEMDLREISGSLTEGILRPLGKLPLSQEKDIAISIFPEKEENTEKAFLNCDT
jgi:hypothetical protein